MAPKVAPRLHQMVEEKILFGATSVRFRKGETPEMPMNDAMLLDLVGAIYDCAVEPDGWPDVLARLCKAHGFVLATVDLNRLPHLQHVFNHCAGLSAEDRAEMLRLTPLVTEIWGGIEASMVRPINQPWILSRITPTDALAEMAYTREWAAPRGLVDSGAIILARDTALIGSIGVATDRAHGIITDRQIAALARLLPHCQRAAQIGGLLHQQTEKARHFEMLVDALIAPVIIVSAELGLIHANLPAQTLLERGDVLLRRNGAVDSNVPGLRRALVRTLSRLGDSDLLVPGSGIGLPIRGKDGTAYTLHVLPLAHGNLRTGLVPGAAAAIFVGSVTPVHHPMHDILEAVFGLSPMEIAVFDRILEGASTREVGQALGIAFSTVRTHLLNIFAKTGVNRQVDLIRMAMAMSSPLRQ